MAGLTASSRSDIARRLDGKDRFKELRTSILDPKNPSDYIKNISNLWEDAQKTFLEIGNQLMLAKRNLPHGDFEDMVRVRLPFSTTVAYQLRVVAEAIEQRIVSKDELPPSYSIIYKVVKLSDTERAVARQRNIIRPTVKRRELDSFIAELRNVHANGSERDRDELLRLGTSNCWNKNSAYWTKSDRLRKNLASVARAARYLKVQRLLWTDHRRWELS
jgi:hypothetical protein